MSAPVLDLPQEVQLLFFSYLTDSYDLLRVLRVCKAWRALAADRTLWRRRLLDPRAARVLIEHGRTIPFGLDLRTISRHPGRGAVESSLNSLLDRAMDSPRDFALRFRASVVSLFVDSSGMSIDQLCHLLAFAPALTRIERAAHANPDLLILNWFPRLTQMLGEGYISDSDRPVFSELEALGAYGSPLEYDWPSASQPATKLLKLSAKTGLLIPLLPFCPALKSLTLSHDEAAAECHKSYFDNEPCYPLGPPEHATITSQLTCLTLRGIFKVPFIQYYCWPQLQTLNIETYTVLEEAVDYYTHPTKPFVQNLLACLRANAPLLSTLELSLDCAMVDHPSPVLLRNMRDTAPPQLQDITLRVRYLSPSSSVDDLLPIDEQKNVVETYIHNVTTFVLEVGKNDNAEANAVAGAAFWSGHYALAFTNLRSYDLVAEFRSTAPARWAGWQVRAEMSITDEYISRGSLECIAVFNLARCTWPRQIVG